MKNYFQQKYLFCLILSIFLQSSVIIKWDANTETDFKGYKVYWGVKSGKYDNVVNVGLDTCYTINNLLPGRQYFFAVTSYDKSGNESNFSEEVSIFVEDYDTSNTLTKSLMCFNFPNPFNPQREVTKIRYSLEKAQKISINIYDANENLVRTLLYNEYKSAGEHTEDMWDGKNNNGYYVPNGVYYGVINVSTKKEIIMLAVVR